MTRDQTAAALAQLTGATSRWALAADIVDPPGLRWKQDPVAWASDRAKIAELWSKQREIIESVRDHSLTAVHSCHEIGKSFIAATTACWWLDVHPPGTAFVLSTAPSQPQVEAILWREINRLHSKAGLPGRTNLTEWYLGRELVAFGRKPADTDPSAFQGHHALYFLLIFDEACGIPKALWDSGASLVANEHSRWLAIGNPDDPHGEFAENCGIRNPSTPWHVIQVGYKDTPAYTGEKVSQALLDQLISKRWVDERRAKWGEKSALFISKCEGEFPLEASPFTVMPLPWLEACRWLDTVPTPGDVHEAGIDVGGGGDRTVITERVGMRVGRTLEFVDADPTRTTGQLAMTLKEWGIKTVKVDSIGIGWGIFGRLRELQLEGVHDAEVVPINFGAGPSVGMEDRYLNKRAEVWWMGRELTRTKQWDLGGVDDDTLGELSTPLYEILDSKGKIKIASKEKSRKDLGYSPDRADSLLLAFVPASWEGSVSEAPEDDFSAGLTPGSYGLEDLLGDRDLGLFDGRSFM